jgi:hypothetical protein
MVLVGTLEQMQLFQDNLFDILNKNFKCNLTNPMPNSKENVSDLSKHVYDRLNKNQIKKIELLNSIDFEAWEYAKGLI